ncbi:hypothetical protein ACHAXS_007710 [Conticribra weissflogii]
MTALVVIYHSLIFAKGLSRDLIILKKKLQSETSEYKLRSVFSTINIFLSTCVLELTETLFLDTGYNGGKTDNENNGGGGMPSAI